ncbi:hypothetical protein VTN96DRAFT_7474 [Rasamsonia emersonii]
MQVMIPQRCSRAASPNLENADHLPTAGSGHVHGGPRRTETSIESTEYGVLQDPVHQTLSIVIAKISHCLLFHARITSGQQCPVNSKPHAGPCLVRVPM